MKYKRNQPNLAKQKFEKTNEFKESQEFEERRPKNWVGEASGQRGSPILLINGKEG
jgi:hypothetical protein